MLRKTYGRDLMIAGIFKLCWTVFVIMGGEWLEKGRMAAGQWRRLLHGWLRPAAPTLVGGASSVVLPPCLSSPLPTALHRRPPPAAYYFTRSILMCIRTLEGKDQSIYDAEWKGWVLTGFFFLDAWLLGGW